MVNEPETTCVTDLIKFEKEIDEMDAPANYLHWGFILISVPNLIVIAGMIVLFGIALVAPFPHGSDHDDV